MHGLQWGRVRVNAESAELAANGALRNRASMGPRSCERGKQVDSAEAGQLEPGASMGPRSCERGKMSSHSASLSVSKLQWGRVRVNAERVS